MKHCITTLKVEGLITDGVAGIVYLLNFSGCTMALGSTQPLSEMSTKGITWGRGRVKADGS